MIFVIIEVSIKCETFSWSSSDSRIFVKLWHTMFTMYFCMKKRNKRTLIRNLYNLSIELNISFQRKLCWNMKRNISVFSVFRKQEIMHSLLRNVYNTQQRAYITCREIHMVVFTLRFLLYFFLLCTCACACACVWAVIISKHIVPTYVFFFEWN